jgi:hypothetical protein
MAHKKIHWQMGDRVFGHYHRIPFIGSVGLYHSNQPQRIVIFIDLPIIHKGAIIRTVIVNPKQIRPLTQF